MAVYFGNFTSLTNMNVVAGVVGKRIRVNRLIFTTSVNGTCTLVQDVGGAGEAALTCAFQGRSGGAALDFAFARERPQTAAGLALGVSGDGFGNWGLWIEYELVD